MAHSLEAALWSIGRTTDFRSAVLTAANLGGDADTTAAIAGQLAGAVYGESGIPQEWLDRLAWKDAIEANLEAVGQMVSALLAADRQGDLTLATPVIDRVESALGYKRRRRR